MSILKNIEAYKREEIAKGKKLRPWSVIEADAVEAPPVRSVQNALLDARKGGRYGLIGEIKKASPSKGLIRPDFDPESLARAYEAGGASCLSVLTDTPSFQGSADHLRLARNACNLPVLRKDFLYDPWQVAEARSWGADAILIILSAVSNDQAQEIEEAAFGWNMDVLVEVHDEAEVERALHLKSFLLGINNRHLHDFVTDLATTERLVSQIPSGKRLVISESGFFIPDDLARIARCGVTSFLIGESLMRQPDVEAATRALIDLSDL